MSYEAIYTLNNMTLKQYGEVMLMLNWLHPNGLSKEQINHAFEDEDAIANMAGFSTFDALERANQAAV